MGKKTYVVYNLEMKKFLQYSKWLIQKLKKGRHTYRVGVGVADSVLVGSGGMLPRESFDYMRVLLRLLETHNIYGKWSVTQVIHHMGISQNPSLCNQPSYLRHCHRSVSWKLQI